MGDIDWLIEQAERVEELESLNANKEDLWQTWFKHYKMESMKNVRYRKALEFYADIKNHEERRGTKVFGDVFYDKGKKAREALNNN